MNSDKAGESASIVSLGRIQGPKALKGQLKVTSFDQMLTEWPKSRPLALYASVGPYDGFLMHPEYRQQVYLSTAEPAGKNVWLIELSGIASREAAENLKGLYFGERLASLQELFKSESEPYIFEYIQTALYDYRSGAYEGYIKRIEQIGGRSLAVISWQQQPGEFLMPLQYPFLRHFDRAEGKIYVEDLEELCVEQ